MSIRLLGGTEFPGLKLKGTVTCLLHSLVLPAPRPGVSPTCSGPLLTQAGMCVVGMALTRPPFPLTLLCTESAEGTHRACIPGVSAEGALFISLLFEVHHTETLANQELGHTPWPLARLSQGDLFAKALRPDASD